MNAFCTTSVLLIMVVFGRERAARDDRRFLLLYAPEVPEVVVAAARNPAFHCRPL
jgi:hypothetical protein